MSHYNLVAQFQQVGNVVTSLAIKHLYTKLFWEEHQEFINAAHELTVIPNTYDEAHMIEVLDGLADMRVIQLGCEYHNNPLAGYFKDIEKSSIAYIAEYFEGMGIESDIEILVDVVFEEVMRSNMSKFCESEEVADQTIAWYADKGVNVFSTKHDSHWVIRSSSNQNVDGKDYPEGKILKSVNYFAPNIKAIVDLEVKVPQ